MFLLVTSAQAQVAVKNRSLRTLNQEILLQIGLVRCLTHQNVEVTIWRASLRMWLKSSPLLKSIKTFARNPKKNQLTQKKTIKQHQTKKTKKKKHIKPPKQKGKSQGNEEQRKCQHHQTTLGRSCCALLHFPRWRALTGKALEKSSDCQRPKKHRKSYQSGLKWFEGKQVGKQGCF